MEEVRAPTLPQRNLGLPGVYPELPLTQPEAIPMQKVPHDHYAKPGRRAERAACLSESDSEVSPPSTPGPNPVVPEVQLERMVPPVVAPTTGNEGLVGLPNPRWEGAFRPVENTFPQGPIGAILQPRPWGLHRYERAKVLKIEEDVCQSGVCTEDWRLRKRT